ncbi:methionine adenosyltransferase [Gleimia coleocanis DSM 15436]|uniref:S-adenosylmethionine synthase n=1 Tax=Gleimia coleocanis DSM 15436 TaxID=525245 RepID=C0W1K6_9ACTO|nr:methionine adenosyltransferase [Gleimia coleocanis]EEH63372.1 methionine adenosyltransferase [Gleimia coleocanis DSM 15436]
MKSSRLFSSESVTSGHPDKVCDQISDAVLDAALSVDPMSRVAVETLVTTDKVIVAGEVTCAGDFDVDQIVRDTVRKIGYVHPGEGFDADSVEVTSLIHTQSPDIAQSVDRSQETREENSVDEISMQGAGDQGIMFGFACDDTPELMPLPISLAHKLAFQLEQVRTGLVPEFRPDGKTQVTLAYENGRPVALDTVVVSTQHAESISLAQIREAVQELVIDPVLAESAQGLDTHDTRFLINPSGRFVQGGPCADTGVTGRKLIVDTYGGFARHGGGAFSGKDATKVDRSASYALRWIAKNIVAAGLAAKAELQVSYAIGRAEPVGLWIDTFGTEKVSNEALTKAVLEVFDLRPSAIIRDLQLRTPGFAATAAYGHFGREGFTWEDTSRAQQLAALVG